MIINNAAWRRAPYVHVQLQTNCTSRRQYLREFALDMAKRVIHKQHAGRDSSGANIWPENMPRRVRRNIERERARREFRQSRVA